MDRLLRSVGSRAVRRGMSGEPIWLAVGVALWLVRRARQQGPEVVWKGEVRPGQRLEIITSEPAPPA